MLLNTFTFPPQLMAILNLTPDSFSDGGKFNHLDSALRRCEQLIKEGADIIDLGGESTRPGAQAVSEQEEINRVLPILEAIKQQFPIKLSVDTSSETVMRLALGLQVDIINDVRALQKLNSLDFLAQSDCRVCLMHMLGQPQSMQEKPQYDDILQEVKLFLLDRVRQCEQAGIHTSRLILDPGFGFGKTLQHNLRLLNRLDYFTGLGFPVLSGTSRKSMIGMTLKKDVQDRLFGSLATVSLAVQKGASIIRVHDVAASRDVIDMTWAVMNEDSQ